MQRKPNKCIGSLVNAGLTAPWFVLETLEGGAYIVVSPRERILATVPYIPALAPSSAVPGLLGLVLLLTRAVLPRGIKSLTCASKSTPVPVKANGSSPRLLPPAEEAVLLL